MSNYDFDIDKFCEQLNDDWVLKELKVGEYAEESESDKSERKNTKTN